MVIDAKLAKRNSEANLSAPVVINVTNNSWKEKALIESIFKKIDYFSMDRYRGLKVYFTPNGCADSNYLIYLETEVEELILSLIENGFRVGTIATESNLITRSLEIFW